MSEPKLLAIFTNLHASRFSVRTKIPGDIFQFECEVVVGQNRSSWRYFPVRLLGASRPEPKFLAIVTDLDEWCLSVRTKIPGDINQWGREAFFSQGQNSWRYSPV